MLIICRSPIKWVGGKSRLVKVLRPLIPEHEGYVEVFGGAGWLLFAKSESKWEVLNDLDSNLYNFWHTIQYSKDEFINSFKYEIISRAKFNEFKHTYINKKYKNSIEQAHIFYYLLMAGSGASLPDGGGSGFGTAKDKNRLNLNRVSRDIENAYSRLKKVTIECSDFRKIFKSYDSESTFFYLDPPYRNTKRNSYPVGDFTDSDYMDLANNCKAIKGKFLLTINDDTFIRELFKDFNITSVDAYYSTSSNKSGRKKYPELIIKNY